MNTVLNNSHPLRIALFTYSTSPRGGVVHTLALAEHIQAMGMTFECSRWVNKHTDSFGLPRFPTH